MYYTLQYLSSYSEIKSERVIERVVDCILLVVALLTPCYCHYVGLLCCCHG